MSSSIPEPWPSWTPWSACSHSVDSRRHARSPAVTRAGTPFALPRDMTPRIDASLRAKLHRIIDEVFADTSPHDGSAPDGTGVVQVDARDPTLLFLGRLTELEAADDEPSLQVGELSIDLAGHEVFAAGRRIRLTHREFALLRHLARNVGRACTREELVIHVWADKTLTSARTVDIHIHRLRHKLGRPFIELLETLRNVGYKLRASPGQREPLGLTKESRSASPLNLLTYREAPANLTAGLGQSP